MLDLCRDFLAFLILLCLPAALFASPVTLDVIEKNLLVNGKPSRVFAIEQPDGTFGLFFKKGDIFDVTVKNKTSVPLVLHWHGIFLPNDQDGVPYVTQLPISPGKSYHYQFPLHQTGTYWFHSHDKLQEQKLMAAPLIIYETKASEKEAIMFIQDFSFEDPRVIYESLRNKMAHEKMMTMPMSGTTDLSDVKFDAYLTNHRTLAAPDVIQVTPKETVRLRVINASASSNYYIDLGKLTGTLIAVDGEAIKPIQGNRFQIAIGSRLDLRIKIPAKGLYPILALPEGTKQQTGLVLSTEANSRPTFSQTTTNSNAPLDDTQELKLQPAAPLPSKPITQTFTYRLEGNMQSYRWTMNGEAWPNITPYIIKKGERIALIFNNQTDMSHPMHLHGHFFQIVEINGQPINGRKGDTVNVMPHTFVKVIFDADNPGIWMIHCHILYHQEGGMMTTIDYQGYPNRFTTEQRLQGEKLHSGL